VLKAKASGRKKGNERRLHEVVVRVLDATLLQRRAMMCYASAASRRTKTYIVEPQRVAYADGGVYVIAWVPEYGELRTFAAERIATFGLLDETFHPRALPTQPFPNSLGVYSGPAERIVVEFDPDAAPFVREREWHPSQSIAERGDGGIVLTMEVCNDRALRTWILGFGPSARVTEPVRLIQEIFEAATETRRRYQRTIAGQRPEMLSIKAS
jgi:predicted DNA-binding transcriptional regulator YafY